MEGLWFQIWGSFDFSAGGEEVKREMFRKFM